MEHPAYAVARKYIAGRLTTEELLMGIELTGLPYGVENLATLLRPEVGRTSWQATKSNPSAILAASDPRESITLLPDDYRRRRSAKGLKNDFNGRRMTVHPHTGRPSTCR